MTTLHLLDDPQLASIRQDMRLMPGDVASGMACYDWLMDHPEAGADVLACLYVGTAPDHANGLPQHLPSAWLTERGETVDAKMVARMGIDAKVMSRAFSVHPDVIAALGDQMFEMAASGKVEVRGDDPRLDRAKEDVAAACRRDLKRRVLALPWARGGAGAARAGRPNRSMEEAPRITGATAIPWVHQ